jgi:hypothetical protein
MTTNQIEHTPTPWVVAYGMIYQQIGNGAVGPGIAKMDRDEEMTMPTERDANAELIVRAVNSHEALVSALDDCMAFLCDPITAEWINRSGYNTNNYGKAVINAHKALSDAKGGAR